jgi:hypothetical protein
MSICVLLFVLHASARMPWLEDLNIWLLSSVPLLLWTLAFAARAYGYGSALSHQQFLEAQARDAQQSWQGWAQRGLAVLASCVLLPDQVSASVLAQGPSGLHPRTGKVRRIAFLHDQTQRGRAGLQMLIQALAPALQKLPAEQNLRITLLSDADPVRYQALRDDLQQTWFAVISQSLPAQVTVTEELSWQWIDERVKTASATIELILVLQLDGTDMYSDGLAALLLCPDGLAPLLQQPVTATLLRPMPLEIDALEHEFAMFMHTQPRACKATGVLADETDWQPLISNILANASTHGAALNVERQWLVENLCGRPGPLGHWLVTALGVEMVQHQREPLLLLARDSSQHWITTVTKGALA